jgi:hypothetical protein
MQSTSAADAYDFKGRGLRRPIAFYMAYLSVSLLVSFYIRMVITKEIGAKTLPGRLSLFGRIQFPRMPIETVWLRAP